MNEGAKSGSVKGVVVYLILAFGIAWGFWCVLLPDAAAGHLALFELSALPGAFAPAIATYIVRKWVTREGFADAGLALNLRQWRYYLIAWFMPFGVVVFIAFAAVAFGLGHPDFSMSQALAAQRVMLSKAIAGIASFVIPLQLFLGALIATPLLFGEEFGWRGYLQLRLFPRSPTLAAISTGIIWGLWHLPVILRGYEMSGDPVVVTAVFCVGAVLVSIIFGWLREKSGSVWVTSLAHSATNTIGGSLTVLWFSNEAKGYFVSYLGVLGWIPLGLVCIWIVVRRANASSVRAGDG